MLLHAIHFEAAVLPPEVAANNGSASTTQARTGSYSCRVTGNNVAEFTNYWRITLSASQLELYLQAAIRTDTTPIGASRSRILRWEGTDGSVLGGLKVNATSGKIEVYTGDFATLVGTSTIVIATNTWYLIELHIVIADSGSIELRVDLNSEVTYSGDTKPAAISAIGYIRFSAATSTGYCYWDDGIINTTTGTRNNSWPGGAKISYLVPTGDGATKDWTPSAGSDHYALVDEKPPSATDNLIATANGVVDILTFGDLPVEAVSVRAVIPEIYAFKGSSTAPTKLAIGVDINAEGVEYSGDLALALAQGLVRNIWEERPGGGNFSVNDITNMSLYLKSAA
jgi:hypothetical protein